MKHLYLFCALALALVLVTPGVAQEGFEIHGDIRDLGDGAVEFDTTDIYGNAVKVVIDPPLEDAVENPWDNPDHPLFKGYEVDELEKFPTAAFLKGPNPVNVWIAIDDNCISCSTATNILEVADNALWRDFGINYVIQGCLPWSCGYCSYGDSACYLYDLQSKYRSYGPGMVIGFTCDSAFTAGGIAFVYGSNPGTGFQVLKNQGSTSTPYAARHEAGHNYGVCPNHSGSHCYGSMVCMMNYTYTYSVDFFSTSCACDVTVWNHRNWF